MKTLEERLGGHSLREVDTSSLFNLLRYTRKSKRKAETNLSFITQKDGFKDYCKPIVQQISLVLLKYPFLGFVIASIVHIFIRWYWMQIVVDIFYWLFLGVLAFVGLLWIGYFFVKKIVHGVRSSDKGLQAKEEFEAGVNQAEKEIQSVRNELYARGVKKEAVIKLETLYDEHDNV